MIVGTLTPVGTVHALMPVMTTQRTNNNATRDNMKTKYNDNGRIVRNRRITFVANGHVIATTDANTSAVIGSVFRYRRAGNVLSQTFRVSSVSANSAVARLTYNV